MKFVISFFLSLNAFSSPINLYHEKDATRPRVYKTLLIEEYKIPEDLIRMHVTEDCEELREKGKLDLCLKNNGDLIVVSADYSFINESLKVFRAP